MPRIRLLREANIGGATMPAGTEVDADDGEADELMALGAATPAEAAPASEGTAEDAATLDPNAPPEVQMGTVEDARTYQAAQDRGEVAELPADAAESAPAATDGPQPERPQGDGPHGMSEGDPDSGGMLVGEADGAPRGA